MRYFIHTFGCQSNKADSERIAGDYEARGYQEALSWQEADEIILNTCSVRQAAEDRVRGLLVNIEKYFQNQARPRPKIIITGCITHFSNQKLHQLFPVVDEILPINEVGFNSQSVRKDKHHAFIPISSGCNSFCTYCIVPYSRGREQSRPQAEILTKSASLADQGYDEVTLAWHEC
jgi:tRNA-2-methylthio-N6-dimethylallyladenosine synthase